MTHLLQAVQILLLLLRHVSLLWNFLLLCLRPQPLSQSFLGLLDLVTLCLVKLCSLSPRSGETTGPPGPTALGRQACKPGRCFGRFFTSFGRFKLYVGSLERSDTVCHGFPTEGESRVYARAAGARFPDSSEWN